MTILISQPATIRKEDLHQLGPVKKPLDGPTAHLVGKKFIDDMPGIDSMGIWECSPGRWQRTIMQEEFAHFLTGSQPDPVVVDIGHKRTLDLAIEVPGQELGPVASNELWDETYDRIAQLVQEHRSTLVFVNTRRLAERVAFNLADRLGEDAVAIASAGELGAVVLPGGDDVAGARHGDRRVSMPSGRK